MAKVSYARIAVNKEALRCVVQSEWNSRNGVEIKIASPESAWTGELSEEEVEAFVKTHSLDHSVFLAEMQSALQGNNENGTFMYSIDSSTFTWKRLLSSGLVAKLGQIKVEKVPVPEIYEFIINKAIEQISILKDDINLFKTENSTLRKDRDCALEKVKQIASLKDEWEKKLYGRFLAVLNAKKERIESLMKELEDMDSYKQIKTDQGAQEESSKTESHSENESSDQDPYKDDTDVDSDIEQNKETSKGPVSPPPGESSSSLRRRCDIFDSFESSPGSPASPVPVLPKRFRYQTSSHKLDLPSTSSILERKVSEDEVEVRDDDNMESLTPEENTQDLLERM